MEKLLDSHGKTLEEFLADYHEDDYPRPSVTVDVAVFTWHSQELRVLLIKRKNHPYLKQWALPGGFLDPGEAIETAARRELMEETGVERLPLRAFGVFGDLDRDPRTRVISVGHFAIAPMHTLQPAAGDDAAEVGWYSIGLHAGEHTETGKRIILTLTGENGACIQEQAEYAQDAFGGIVRRLPHIAGTAPQQQLATDHAFMLISCLHALLQYPCARIAGLLTGDNQQVYHAAIARLNALLDVFD